MSNKKVFWIFLVLLCAAALPFSFTTRPEPYIFGWLPFPLFYWWILVVVNFVFLFRVTRSWLAEQRKKEEGK